ncbi:hypothetical protein HPB48_001016 [Haemaphysalis longicornis]|uniref:Uncharacterized protein n=1 Tax=Haemaphysalis longicornis TaxID=44386 RepID=A0A9J6G3I8_HAELO|nr:hypothetical protein HPB48_001016 [Haemaphysalis longicornis]
MFPLVDPAVWQFQRFNLPPGPWFDQFCSIPGPLHESAPSISSSTSASRVTDSSTTPDHHRIKLATARAPFVGLGSTHAMRRSYKFPLLFTQVNNRFALLAPRTRYRALLVLPSPCCCVAIVCDCCRVISELLLLLSGDIELNPGPNTRAATAEDSSEIVKLLQQLQSGQASLLAEVKSIQAKLSETDLMFTEIKERLSKIEGDCSSLKSVKSEVQTVRTLAEGNASEIAKLVSRMDDSDDRARRSNLLFFGVTDSFNETWAQSESSVINVCSTNLQIEVAPTDIERAHRLGKFVAGKNRPIIVKFSHFKVKNAILSNAKNLKDTDFSISEDYSPNTRLARKNLLQFANSQKKSFKLRYDKLTIGDTTYVFDHSSNSVVPRQV